MLRIAYGAVSELSQYMDHTTEQRTVKDSVSNGLLAYRPNYETGKLEKVVEQDWARVKQSVVGNHRMSPEWFEPRYDWLSDEPL